MSSLDDKDGMRRAERLIKAGLAAAPDDAGAHFSMGQILRLQGHCEEALDEYQTATTLNRNFANAYGLLAACKMRTGTMTDVIPLLERAIRLDPSSPIIGSDYLRIGVVALFQSRGDDSIAWLEKARMTFAARQQRDDLSATHSWLAAAYALKGDTSRATMELVQAQNLGEYPKSIEQFCRAGQWCANPAVKASVEATYYKGLRLANWSDH
jgi:tetratricopeptide (TPR) repeat protein